MLDSRAYPLVAVTLPYAERQLYMGEFDLANPVMPTGYEDYLQIVASLCREAGYDRGTAYMTVDEKVVKAGATQRKPGPHVDGLFDPTVIQGGRWGHGGWNHGCNNVPLDRMSVIIATSAVGPIVYYGTFDATPRDDGDLSHIADQLGEGHQLRTDYGYLLTPDCVHESPVMTADTQRSFLRIALPV